MDFLSGIESPCQFLQRIDLKPLHYEPLNHAANPHYQNTSVGIKFTVERKPWKCMPRFSRMITLICSAPGNSAGRQRIEC